MNSDERMKVLTMLSEGKINAEEAGRLLDALGRASEPERPDVTAQLGHNVSAVLNKVHAALDRVPDHVGSEHLPKVGKGVGRVVEILGGILQQGIGLIETYVQPTYNFAQELTWADLEGIVTLEVQNTHGLIHIVGEERSDVAVNVSASISGESHDAAAEFFTSHPIVLRREGGQILVAPPASLSQSKVLEILQRHRYNFEVRVPTRLVPLVSTVSGDTVLEGMRYGGRGRVKTVSGEVRVRTTEGDLDIDAISGDLGFSSYKGRVDARTVSGDLTCTDASVSGKLASVSGDIEVEGRLTGELRAKTISGDVRLEVVAPEGVSASTTSGDLGVRLKEGSSGYVDANTRSGDMDARLPLDEAIAGKRHLKGRLAGGNASIVLSTLSGDLKIGQ